MKKLAYRTVGTLVGTGFIAYAALAAEAAVRWKH